MEKAENSNDKYILQSVANAFDILDLLTENDELTIQQIAEKLGLSRSSVFRLLTTMESRHYVRRTEGTKYRLGIKLTFIGNIVYNRMDIIQYAHPHLLELCSAVSETCSLAIPDDETHIRFADRVLNMQSMRTNTWIGATMESHLTASGKALLAFSSLENQENYISKARFYPMTEHSIITPATLREELLEIKNQGFSIDNEESEEGLYCIASPVLDLTGYAIATVSVSGPVSRMRRNQETVIHFVCRTARNISHSISNGPPQNAVIH